MHTVRRLCLASFIVLFASACQPGSSRGLALPEGDVELGQQVFVELECTACHVVTGLELPPPTFDPIYTIALGGQRKKDYPELVTSIINPSHRIAGYFENEGAADESVSPMRNYNDVMTVAELVNLTEFLMAQYNVELVPRYRYSPYIYPD